MASDRRRPQRSRVDPARRAAFDVLDAVDSREAYANLLLPRLLSDRGITGRDAALATELAYGTLRGQGTYDAVLAACSDRPLGKLDPPVLLTLRIGAHQLLATRIGSHAAVATSVDLAKDVAGQSASGYVNAVLRRVATRGLDEWLPLVAPSPGTDPDGYLSVRHSYPRWIVAAYRAALGADAGPAELEAALAAGNERPRVTMAVTPGTVERDEVMPAGAEPTRWSPYGFTLPGGDPASLIVTGHAVVQDEASQVVALLLAGAEVLVPEGARSASSGPFESSGSFTLRGNSVGSSPIGSPAWLDMCAGPGGKARMLHGLATLDKAVLVAAEVHPHRARLVRSALTGRGTGAAGSFGMESDSMGAAGVLIADGRWPSWRDGAFDRVLVDVPCTGLGALRRRPEARWRKSLADLRELGKLQRALLRSALAAARPGGVVAYVTCSPVPAETSSVIAGVLGAGSGAQILDAPALLPQIPDLRSAADPRFAQFWPHRHGTDAIFIALLRRAV